MGSVTGLTAAKMLELSDANIVGGTVNGSGRLILSKRGGGTIDAGLVKSTTPGPPGEVTTANLNAAVADLEGKIDDSGLGMLAIIQQTANQNLIGFADYDWKDVTGLTVTRTFTPGRYLNVGLQLAIETADPAGAEFEVQVLRVGASSVVNQGGATTVEDRYVAMNASRTFVIPGTWTGAQTLKVQVRTSSGYASVIRNANVAGVLSLEDKGKP